MQYVNKIYSETLEVKQSKFVAYIMPYIEYDFMLQRLRQEHPKARHFVVAYRYLNEFNQIVEHFSDDGEPKGTSGKPTLMVLQGVAIINSAVITVRYFGGTKLGTGGLVRAYSDAVNLVLKSTSLIEYKEKITKIIYLEYANIGKIEYSCSEYGITIIDKIFDLEILYKIQGAKNDMKSFLEKVDRIIYHEQRYPSPT